MNPNYESFVRTASLVVIAVFVVIAYFHGWG
jgi:hypothetical protein